MKYLSVTPDQGTNAIPYKFDIGSPDNRSRAAIALYVNVAQRHGYASPAGPVYGCSVTSAVGINRTIDGDRSTMAEVECGKPLCGDFLVWEGELDGCGNRIVGVGTQLKRKSSGPGRA